MYTLALTPADAALWITVITTAVGAIAAAVVSVIAAIKGSAANAKADVLNDRANSLASHAQSLDRQITAVAQNQPVQQPPGNITQP